MRRIGQTADRVRAYYFVATDTVEEDILNLIEDKRDVVSQVLDGQTAQAGILEGVVGPLLKGVQS